MSIKCTYCGKFTKLKDITIKFTPDSYYTIEKSEFICKRCK